MRCDYDALKKCIIDRYWWCMDCYKSLQRKGIKKRYNKVYVTKDTRACIMCEIINATNKSGITEHHLVPNGLSVMFLSHKIGYVVNMCYDHHRLFNALVEPIIDMIKSREYPHKGRMELTQFLLFRRLPDLVKRIGEMVNEGNRK